MWYVRAMQIIYVGYTARHLLQRFAEHKYSAIGEHLLDVPGDKSLLNEDQPRVLKKRHGKFDCLVYEMLFDSSKN